MTDRHTITLNAFIVNNANSKDTELSGRTRLAYLKDIALLELPIPNKFYEKAERFLETQSSKRVSDEEKAHIRNKLKTQTQTSTEQTSKKQAPRSKIPDSVKKLTKKQEVIDLLEQLQQLISDLPIGIEVITEENGAIIIAENENYDKMIKVLTANGVNFSGNIKENLTKKITELTTKQGVKVKAKEEEESIKAQEIEPDQLDPDFVQASLIADQDEDTLKSGYVKYEDELIDAYLALGLDFFEYDLRYKNMSSNEIEKELEKLKERAVEYQQRLRESGVGTPEYPKIDVLMHKTVQFTEPEELATLSSLPVQSLESVSPEVSPKTEVESSVGVEAVVGSQSIPPISDPTDQGAGENKLGENQSSSGSLKMPFKERYHTKALELFFENASYPYWDLILEKNILGSNMSAEERIDRMESIIANHGSELYIKKRLSNTLEELNELQQLQFCLLRNLHIGPRIHQSVSVDLNQLNKIKSLANSLAGQNNTESTGQVSEQQVSQIESQLGLGQQASGGQVNVQSEKEYKFDIHYDKYLASSSRRSDLPIRPFTENIVSIKETENSISGLSRSIYSKTVPKSYYPEVGTFDY